MADTPDQYEEKAIQKTVRQKRKNKSTAHRHPSQQIPASLPAPLTLPQEISVPDQSYPNPVVSFYLSFTPEMAFMEKHRLSTWFNSALHQEKTRQADFINHLSHTQKQVLESDLSSIHDYVLNSFPSEAASSLIIFRSGLDLNKLIKLPIPSQNLLFINHHPVLGPLNQLIQDHPPHLYLHLSEKQAQISFRHLGYQTELANLKSFVPSVQLDASRPGKVQRHRESLLQNHFKKIISSLSQFSSVYLPQFIIISGDKHLIDLFLEPLPTSLREKIVSRQ